MYKINESLTGEEISYFHEEVTFQDSLVLVVKLVVLVVLSRDDFPETLNDGLARRHVEGLGYRSHDSEPSHQVFDHTHGRLVDDFGELPDRDGFAVR